MLIHRAGAWGSLLVVCSNFLCVVGWMRDFGSDVAAVCDHGDPLGQTPRQKLQQNQDLPTPPLGTKDTVIQAETAANKQKSASTIFENLFISGTVPGWERLHHKQFFKGMALAGMQNALNYQ